METFMFCCWAKIAYYIVLIFYHVCDVYIDKKTLVLINDNGTFAGASTNSTVVEGLFGFSFLACCLFSISMSLVYLYYIIFHLRCVCEQYESPWRKCDKRCNRRFVSAELWISLLELFFKDDIRSGLLFWVCVSESISIKPGWQSKALSACSVIAHFKPIICFVTKLCGCGEEEEHYFGCSAKPIACFIGIMGSALFLICTFGYVLYAFVIAPYEVQNHFAYNFE